MNLYRVLSEELYFPGNYYESPEPYKIFEYVVCGTRGQAKWDAWKKDRDSFTGYARDMPKFSVKLIAKNIKWGREVVTYSPDFPLEHYVKDAKL